MGKRLGIDLGSTHSCSAYIDELGISRIVESLEGGTSTLSAVFFDSTTKEFVVGDMAEEEGILYPENLIRCIKNHIGDSTYMINFDGQDYSSQAIASLILKKLILDAETHFGDEEIEGVVLSCPVYWGDVGRESLINAAKSIMLAKNKPLNVIGVVTDVEAISRAYVDFYRDNYQKNILIYDLGGGTFDAAVVKLNADQGKIRIEVLAHNGEPYTGGMNWNHALTFYVLQEYCKLTGDDESELMDDFDFPWFAQKIEKAKRALSVKESTKIIVSFNGHKEIIEVSRDAFEAETERYLDVTLRIVTEMMQNAKLTIEGDIDEVVLVGGASKMPQIRRRLQEEYNKPIVLFEPEFAVAKGAAIIANDFLVT